MSILNKEDLVKIILDQVMLEGILVKPQGETRIVIFAHGSGSSRLSPRNRFVAGQLQKAGLGTLLFDLLTEEEDQVYESRFNIDLLAERLKDATLWLENQFPQKKLTIGYFGASTGAAAALVGASDLEQKIKAIVSRGGRPDLAMKVLPKVISPTLLIVGGNDFDVIELNKSAYEALQAKKELKIVSGASHLFEEPGTLEEVASLACLWFKKYLDNN